MQAIVTIGYRTYVMSPMAAATLVRCMGKAKMVDSEFDHVKGREVFFPCDKPERPIEMKLVNPSQIVSQKPANPRKKSES